MVDEDGWSELTSGGQQPIRVSAPDLKQATRIRERVRTEHESAAVILDVTVAVAHDFRAARSVFGAANTDTVHYAGTVDGLVGLLLDIESAGVADGVTLVPASPQQDLGALGRDVLGRLAVRERARAS